MCLVAFAVGATKRYPLVIAANRDELHQRPSAVADWWQDHPDILGGRDLLAGGSWLAVDQRGRFAAVTNVREPSTQQYMRSRGHLVRDFLSGNDDVRPYLLSIRDRHSDYGPFNLLLFDGAELHYVSNRAPCRRLETGVYALSNTRLGSSWPKVRRAREGLAKCLNARDPISCLLKILADAGPPPQASEAAQPADRHESALFIKDQRYGTRSSTVVLLSSDGEIVLTERCFGPDGEQIGESHHRFRASSQRPGVSAARG